MISAFGVEHSEIAKGYRVVKVPKGLKTHRGKTPTGAQLLTQGKGAKTPGVAKKTTGALKRVTEKSISLSEVGQGTGTGIAGVGRFMRGHPGLTGTAVVGGTAGGTGYYLNQRKPRGK